MLSASPAISSRECPRYGADSQIRAPSKCTPRADGTCRLGDGGELVPGRQHEPGVPQRQLDRRPYRPSRASAVISSALGLRGSVVGQTLLREVRSAYACRSCIS